MDSTLSRGRLTCPPLLAICAGINSVCLVAELSDAIGFVLPHWRNLPAKRDPAKSLDHAPGGIIELNRIVFAPPSFFFLDTLIGNCAPSPHPGVLVMLVLRLHSRWQVFLGDEGGWPGHVACYFSF